MTALMRFPLFHTLICFAVTFAVPDNARHNAQSRISRPKIFKPQPAPQKEDTLEDEFNPLFKAGAYPQFPFKFIDESMMQQLLRVPDIAAVDNNMKCKTNNNTLDSEIPFCVAPKKGEASFNNHNICPFDDSCCGDWNITSRTFTPVGCKYRDVTPQQAAKCMKKRTIACIGDSQVRDLCWNLGKFIEGVTVDQAPEIKFDRMLPRVLRNSSIQISGFHYPTSGLVREGFVLPNAEEKIKHGYDYEIQAYAMYLTEHYNDSCNLRDLLNNRIRTATAEYKVDNKLVYANITVSPIDFALIHTGLHESVKWRHTSKGNTTYGENYWNLFITKWLEVKDTVKVPSVWIGLNAPCILHSLNNRLETRKPMFIEQSIQVEHTNAYLHQRFQREKLPYFDTSSVNRTPVRCQLAVDQTHLRQWVDTVRAKILLNHLCDEEWNWIGTVDRFID